MAAKRPIDRLRESGGLIQLDNAGGGAPEFYKIGEKRFLAVTANAVHEIKLPDQIDPGRTNPRLKPIQQRVVDYGTDDEFVCRVLLTAKNLLRDDVFGPDFDHVRALALAFDGLVDLVDLRQIQRDLVVAQQAAWEAHQRAKATDSVHMPSVPDIRVRCETFLQRAAHVVACLGNVARLFYGDRLKKKWVDRLRNLAVERHGEDHPLSRFMAECSGILLFVINARNCVEHRETGHCVDVADFVMDASGDYKGPSIDVIHPDVQVSGAGASVLMKDVTEGLVATYEGMIAALCATNVRHPSGLHVFVDEIPETHRRNKYLRYRYFASIGGQIAPFG